MRVSHFSCAALLMTSTLAVTEALLNKTSSGGIRKFNLPHRSAPKYPETKKCDPTRCLCTPQAVIDFFNDVPNFSVNATTNPDRDSNVYPGPLCVGESIYGRVNGNRVPKYGFETLARVDGGRNMVFVVDHNSLEKILALGPFRAKQILALLGFGTIDKVNCGTPGNQTLVVFDLKDTTVPLSCKRKDPTEVYSSIPNSCNKAPVMSAIWDNALPWLEQVYKKDLSYLEPAMDKIKSERFETLTGCRPGEVAALNFPDSGNSAKLQACGCSQEFADAAQKFRAGSIFPGCFKGTLEEVNAYPEKYLYYTMGKNGQKENYCQSDVDVMKLTGNDAVELRAYFYATSSFNPFYTGYGYTANDYGIPQVEEFWINNFAYSKEDWASVELDCSKSSDVAEQKAVSAASVSGFVPYMIGYDY